MMRDLIPFGRSRSLREAGPASHPLVSLHNEIDRLFDGLWQDFDLPRLGREGAQVARLDVSETESEIQVTAELPGIEEQDVEVTLADGVLSIRGEKRHESERNDKRYHLMERSFGAFERSIRVGTAVERDKVKATFKNGVLTVTLPKTEESQAKAKRIPVKAA